jgi:hypothetical protein
MRRVPPRIARAIAVLLLSLLFRPARPVRSRARSLDWPVRCSLIEAGSGMR